MLKDCTSVKVETETTPGQSQKPEEVGGAGAGAEPKNQVSGKEDNNSANDTGETAPTQEVVQSGETDLQMKDLEKAE